GQRDAPLQPTARPAGVVIAGTNPLALDAVAATVIGLDPGKTPLLRDAWNAPAAWQLPPDGASVGDIEVSFDDEGRTQRLDVAALAKRINLAFEPPAGWVGAIERNPPSTGNGSSNPDAPASTSPAASEKKAVEHLVPPIGAFRP
ncbi:MAG: hypothetical protein ACE5EX_03060, partial [Phycisphaerae bacterium]